MSHFLDNFDLNNHEFIMTAVVTNIAKIKSYQISPVASRVFESLSK